jgi:hypothetical protein
MLVCWQTEVLLLSGIDSVPLLKLLALEEIQGGSVQMIIQPSKLDAARLLAISTFPTRIGLRKSVEKFQRNCVLSISFAGHTQSMAL